MQARFQHDIASKIVNRAHMDPFSTHNADVHRVCNLGGLPPQRPPTFYLCRAWLAVKNIAPSRRIVSITLYTLKQKVFKFQHPSYRNFVCKLSAPGKPRKLVSNIILQAKTEPRWALSEPLMQRYIGFAYGGGLHPTQPPSFFYALSGLQSTKQNLDGRFRTHAADVLWVCTWGGGGCPPQPPTRLFYSVHGLRSTEQNADAPFQNP